MSRSEFSHWRPHPRHGLPAGKQPPLMVHASVEITPFDVTVPPRHAPSATLAWGRMPVVATVDGHRWKTSVWRERSGRTLLAVPKAVREAKHEGDRVQVALEFTF